MNTRCRDIESQAMAFSNLGHNIFLYTQSSHGELHDNFRGYGFIAHSTSTMSRIGVINILLRIYGLVTYCWRNQIGITYAHLEPSNFIAVISQFMVRSRVVICRHHSDFARLIGMDSSLSYRLTYWLAKDIIVVSDRAKKYMINEEKVPASKIHHIDLSYNFDLYDVPNKKSVEEIKSLYKSDILLLNVGRLNKLKRPQLAIQLIFELVEKNFDAKLIILGEGELNEELLSNVVDKGLEDRIHLLGYVNNVLDYMSAADFLIHPSISESSCISLKEAGLAELTPIVCKGVGDFDSVIENERNGFTVNQNEFVHASIQTITKYKNDKNKLQNIGEALHTDILNKFSIKNVIPYYENVFHAI